MARLDYLKTLVEIEKARIISTQIEVVGMQANDLNGSNGTYSEKAYLACAETVKSAMHELSNLAIQIVNEP